MRDIKFRGFDTESGVMLQDISHRQRDGIEVMQFTGLKDRHGVEIYEGDIVRFDTRAGGVFVRRCWFDEREASFKLDGYTYTSDDLTEMRGEVIGNIYEHPHLLKGKENV